MFAGLQWRHHPVMAKEVRIRRVRSTLYISIPRRVARQLFLEAGDVMHLSITRDGLLLSPYDPGQARAIEAYERLSRKHREAFRSLAG